MTREESILTRLHEHLDDSLQKFEQDRMIGLFLQGSQNYGLDYEASDVDTKLIVVPTFKDIVFNKSPISTTQIRSNNEHIDFKDVRLYMQTFRKQNPNFLEILFTDFNWVNWTYKDQWDRLVLNREAIARYNPFQAIKAMKGMALEKYHAMEHQYPSKIDTFRDFGYDPKQLHHLLRMEEFIQKYINGESYSECLNPSDKEYLIAVKKGLYNLDQAKRLGEEVVQKIIIISDNYALQIPNEGNAEVEKMLNEVQYEIMKRATEMELKGD